MYDMKNRSALREQSKRCPSVVGRKNKSQFSFACMLFFRVWFLIPPQNEKLKTGFPSHVTTSAIMFREFIPAVYHRAHEQDRNFNS